MPAGAASLIDEALRQVVESGAIVPSLWRLKVANGLQIAVRRKRIDAKFRDASIVDLRVLPIVIDPDVDRHAWGSTLILAERCQPRLYDAAYLELAQRVGMAPAPLDKQMRAAGVAIGVALLE